MGDLGCVIVRHSRTSTKPPQERSAPAFSVEGCLSCAYYFEQVDAIKIIIFVFHFTDRNPERKIQTLSSEDVFFILFMHGPTFPLRCFPHIYIYGYR